MYLEAGQTESEVIPEPSNLQSVTIRFNLN